MQESDARNLIRFNTRMDMYICPSNRANVVAFLCGYQFGAGNECRFTELIGQHLEKRYRIKPGALGWAEQIARLAEKRSLEWMDVYLLISSEVLSFVLGKRGNT